jgi:hypothetical protein
MRRGDFSASPTPIYDPLTGAANGTGRTAFPGNIIPQNRLDPIVQKLIATLPLPTFPELLADNYFATGLFEFARRKTDAKVTVNATPKLILSGRLGWLNYDFTSPPMFGDLGGSPVFTTAAKAGHGLGDTYTITGSANYTLKSNLLIEAYTGITKIKVLSEPFRMEENLGLDFLGIPGTNGPSRLYGGWPQFNVTNLSMIGYAGSENSPYLDDNWQYQYSANATWVKSNHTFRFGGDIVRQALNRFEAGNGSGTFAFAGGPTTISGGPSPNVFNTVANFVLGLPTSISTTRIPFENNQTRSRNWQFSTFVKDQWQVNRVLTASLGVRWDHFPMGTRTTRGLERFDYENNQMLICGVGSVPEDCGYAMGFGNFSPRLGVAYRPTDKLVVRGGYGINYDPYPLAFVRDLLGNYPSGIGLTVSAPNTLQFASRLADGIPPVTVPDVSGGVIPVPANIGARALDAEPKRGYIHSWNVTLQRELPFLMTGQIGYVGTRQRDINQILNINAGQVIGAGDAGRPYFARFRRTAETGLLTNVGWNDYDALQTSLQRRFSQGLQVNVAYTWSRAFGLCCDNLSDGPPQVQAMDYFKLNEATLSFDRPAQFPGVGHRRAPVRTGQALPQRLGCAVHDRRRLAGECAVQRLLGDAVQRDCRRDIIEPSEQQSDGGQGEVRRADHRRHRRRQVVVRSTRVPRGDRGTLRQCRIQHDARPRLRQPRFQRPATVQSGRSADAAGARRNLQLDEHAALREPERERLEPAAERRWARFATSAGSLDHEHSQQRPRGILTNVFPSRSTTGVLNAEVSSLESHPEP